jgi:sugar lactone lactonase YvrE
MFPRTIILNTVIIAAISLAGCSVWQGSRSDRPQILSTVTTFSAPGSAVVEPFGIAVKDGETYVSDGSAGTILKFQDDGSSSVFASGFNTPSGLAILPDGDLVVAETGSHTIKRVSSDGTVTTLAGIENVAGSDDGAAASATFTGPIGIAADDEGNVYIADT